MAIWKRETNLALINDRGKNTMVEFLGINFISIQDDSLTACMDIDHRHRQPIGIMHGGASCVLAETVGSTAANFCVDPEHYCVGLDINTNHIRSIREGRVVAVAKPYHLGKSTQVWSIEIRDSEEKLISVNRLTMAVLKRQS